MVAVGHHRGHRLNPDGGPDGPREGSLSPSCERDGWQSWHHGMDRAAPLVALGARGGASPLISTGFILSHPSGRPWSLDRAPRRPGMAPKQGFEITTCSPEKDATGRVGHLRARDFPRPWLSAAL